ncbi:unnamed protein product [Boreogadus saida]
MADDVPQSPMLQRRSPGSSGRPKRSGSTKSRRAREAKAALQPEDLPGDQQDKQPGGDADVGSSVGILTEEEPEDLYAINLRRLFICRVALSDVTWDSWSEDNELALDRFIEGASIPLMVVYLDPMTGLRVENGMPSQAVDQLAYFIRSSEAPIMPETFETVVLCGTLRCGSGGGGATEGLLRLLNGVHAPLVALSTVLPKNIKNIYSANMHRFLSGLTGSHPPPGRGEDGVGQSRVRGLVRCQRVVTGRGGWDRVGGWGIEGCTRSMYSSALGEEGRVPS